MIKGIIFDFDGVIVDTESKKFKDMQKILLNQDIKLNNKLFNDFVGKKTRFFIKEQYPKISSTQLEKIIEERRKLQYQEIKKNKLINGIKELLIFLKEQKVKMCIATGSERDFVEKILNANEIRQYFDFLVTGEDFKTSKPDPECFVKAISKMNLADEQILIIEDSPAGIDATNSLGIRVFAVETYLKKKELEKADMTFKDHFEIMEYLKSQLN